MGYGWHDVVGNVGVLLVLIVYLLLQLQKLAANTAIFSALNAIGALMILVSLSQDFNLSAFIIEAAWLLISIYGLLRIIFAAGDNATRHS